MNFAVILSGGIGTRMKMNGFPKQYIEVNGKPILIYTLQTDEESLLQRIQNMDYEAERLKTIKFREKYINSHGNATEVLLGRLEELIKGNGK